MDKDFLHDLFLVIGVVFTVLIIGGFIGMVILEFFQWSLGYE